MKTTNERKNMYEVINNMIMEKLPKEKSYGNRPRIISVRQGTMYARSLIKELTLG